MMGLLLHNPVSFTTGHADRLGAAAGMDSQHVTLGDLACASRVMPTTKEIGSVVFQQRRSIA